MSMMTKQISKALKEEAKKAAAHRAASGVLNPIRVGGYRPKFNPCR